MKAMGEESREERKGKGLDGEVGEGEMSRGKARKVRGRREQASVYC